MTFKTMQKRILHASSALSGVALLAAFAPGVAFAQDSDEESIESANSQAPSGAIVVTGSRIQRPNYDTMEPSVVVTSEDIEARGFETLGQALNEQPSFGVPGSSPVGGQSDFGQAQSFVNFLGLGSQRTLTLVNGNRFVSSNTASIFGPTGAGSQVDLNIIPTKMVERIDTIAVGGAPVYGSDAIAGTINVILKRDYEGIELDGQYGLSSRGDAANYRLRGLAGTNFADGRGNVTIAGEYNRSHGLTYTDRKLTSSGLFFRNASDPASGYTQELYADRRIPSMDESGIPLVGGDVFGLDFPLSPEQQELVFGAAGFNFGVNSAAGDQLKFDRNGNLIPIDFGRYAGRPGSFGIDFEGGNGFSLVPVSNLLSETERYSALGTLSYELTDAVRFRGEAWYSKSEGTNLRDQPVYNTGLFDAAGTPDGNIILSTDNAFLSDEARGAILDSIANNPFSDQNVLGINQDYFYLGRANTDLASGRSVGGVEVIRFVGGLEGDFQLFGRDWLWDVTGNYGRSTTKSTVRSLIQQNFANAVDAVLDDNGNIVCRPGYTSASIASINSTCAPLNLFGSGVASQAAIDYVTAIATPKSVNEQIDFVGSVGGPVFSLPGGDFSVAMGYEHRQEKSDFDPGAFFRGELQDDGSYASYGRSVPIQPVLGKFNTDEIFGEFLAELISPANGSFIKLLEVKGAARYVDNSIAGSDLTWTLGGRTEIIPSVTFRGNYTRSIRAPAVTEAFNPSSDYFGFAVDPCDAANLGNGPDPATRAANCAADGLPADFSSLSNSRSFSQAIAGNPNLNNEVADSWTIGAVIQPSFIPRFSLSVDYVDIKLKDVIAELSGSNVVANCYDATNFPDNEFCDRISRDENDQLDFIETGYFNQAVLRYKGILADLDYTAPMELLSPSGMINFGISYQFVDTLESRSSEGAAPDQTVDSIGYSPHQAVATLNYQQDNFGAYAQLSYIGETHIDPQVEENYYPDGFNDVDSVIFTNMGVNFDVNDKFEMRFVVDNVFDVAPPYPYPATGGTITYFRGILGRYFRIGATAKF